MKKVFVKAFAALLGVAMIGSSLAASGLAPVTKDAESQLKLVSIKAVDIQTAISGVRSYSELVDTERGYQVNDVVYLATTVEVKNLEKSENRHMSTIEDKDFPVYVGSKNIDLSYSTYSSPLLLSHVYSGINDAAIATVSDVLNVSSVLKYDKDTNEVKYTLRGVQQNSVSALAGLGNVDANNLYVSARLQGSKIIIPALRAKDSSNGKIVLGNQTYSYNWTAPASMAYTVVLTGVSKDNAGADTGEYYAKIQMSGAEKFEDKGFYYVNAAGKIFNDPAVEFAGKTAPVEFVDYIKVNVSKLTVKNAYNVYKYDTPASGMIDTAVPVRYWGDHKDYKGKDLARVNPNRFDNATNKTDALTTVEVAGGVQKVEAVTGYTYNASTKTYTTTKGDVPLTSVVYTPNMTVYAPAYYGVNASNGTAGTPVSVYADTFAETSRTVTKTATTVDRYVFKDLVFDGLPSGRNFDVAVFDAYSGKLVTNPGGVMTGAAYTTSWVETARVATPGVGQGVKVTGTLTVTPTSNSIYPLNATKDSSEAQSWRVLLGTPVAEGPAITTQTVWPTTTLYPGTGVTHVLAATNVLPGAPTLAAPAAANDVTGQTAVLATTGSVVINSAVTVNGTWPGNTLIPASFTATAALHSSNAGPTDSDQYGVEQSSVKTINAKEGGLQVTFRDNWDITPGKEKAIGNVVDLSKIPGFKVYSAAAYWTSNQIAGSPGNMIGNGTGATYAKDADDIASGELNGTGFFIPISGELLKGDFDAAGHATEFAGTVISNTYSAAFITNLDTGADLTAVAPVYEMLAAASGATKAREIGWAQKNILANDSSAGRNLSAGYPNAMLVLKYTSTAGGSYVIGTDPMSKNVALVEDGTNGIATYVITYNNDDQPLVSVVTEATYFDSTDGSSIALFDSINQAKLANRIYHSSVENMSYTTGAGHVTDSAKIISGIKYFGLDTSLATTYKVVEDTFSAKGGAAVYSDEVKGEFKYGFLGPITDDNIDEGTEEDVVDDVDVDVDVDVEPDDNTDVAPDEAAPVAPKTGDASANVAIALAASAIVAAAGLVFVMKKAR